MSLTLAVSLILVSLRKEYDSFVQNYNMHDIGKTVNELHAMLKLHDQTLPKIDAPALHAIRAGKVQKKNKNKKPQLAALGNNIGKGMFKLAYAPKPKIPPPPKKNKKLPQGGSTSGIFTIELFTFPGKSWVYDTGCGTHICNTTQGFWRSRKLKPGALSLYMGNGQHAATKATGSYDLIPKETMGYSFYYPPENKGCVARNAESFENSLITQEASGSLEDFELIQEKDTHPSENTSSHHDEDNQEIYEPQTTLLDPEFDKWLNSINVKMQSMKDNEAWDLVDLPLNDKTVGSKWLFERKTDMDGDVLPCKARLVAKSFTQNPGIDYKETFSHVADIRAIRILIAIAVFYDNEIWQMDVKTAFLNGYLYEEDVKSYLGRCFSMKDLGEAGYILGIKIYTDRSKRLIGLCQSAYIEKILKRLYMENSKRGSIRMQEKLKLSKSQGASTPAESTKQSIFATLYEEAKYIAASDGSKEAVWVRKFIVGLGVVPTIQEPIKMYCDNTRAITIANESGITKGARHYLVKFHYLREVIEFGDVKLEKKKYALQLRERAHMVTCHPSRTPVDIESKMGPEDLPLYAYDPREPYLAALKRILRYVQGTWDIGLHLYAFSTTSLVGYTDVNWAGCPSIRSAKAEYRGVANVVAETPWIHNLLRELHSPLLTTTLVYYDNVSVVYMYANPVQHLRTKHIEIDIHFVRDMVTTGQELTGEKVTNCTYELLGFPNNPCLVLTLYLTLSFFVLLEDSRMLSLQVKALARAQHAQSS
uniref:Ribonuclease H-like domain-containing protein n=1 Tax=Tanacetum cinerariifolium TaxID=118510 RepID=A0A6L2LII6_TANCI|nr:ribonuclease H-like domain-containing protein [Tanacetum cinerariifolium]